jgi:hypothetical protein
MLKKRERDFERKFGRPMEPNDPVFWDPDEDTPTPISEEKFYDGVLRAMVRAGDEPARIAAFQASGIILTEDNEKYADPSDVLAYKSAYTRYKREHPDE